MNVTINIDVSSKLTDEYSAYVSFEYNADIVNFMRSLPFKYYLANTKTWEIPLDKVKQLTTTLPQFSYFYIGKVELLDVKTSATIPDTMKFKLNPYSYQFDAINYGLAHDRWFLGDQMGLGKTSIAINIAVARKINLHYKHCLIVCGVNTLKWNWVNEIHKHSYEDGYIIGQRFTKSGKLKIGSTKDKLTDLEHDLLRSDNLPYFLITNVESFRDENFAKAIKSLCDKNIINMCVADEIHKMKNPSSQQSKGFLKCTPQCRIAMTGTPLMNKPLDLFIILKWLGYEQHAFYSFKNHYCVMGGYGGYEIVGYKNTDELSNKLNEIMLRRLKDDVLDLPEKLYVDDLVEMTKKQSDIYDEVQCAIKLNIDQINVDQNPLSQLIRLRQATGYTGILSSSVNESAKLDMMTDIVDECIANNEKVIIFTNWTSMVKPIVDLLQQYEGIVITGETKDEERQALVDKFQTDNNCMYAVGTIGAMGTGLTLTAAHTVIFVDHPWNKALYDQAVDRAHRIGQSSKVTIHNIMCKDTIDERIWKIVNQKGELSDVIVDGVKLDSNADVFKYLLG